MSNLNVGILSEPAEEQETKPNESRNDVSTHAHEERGEKERENLAFEAKLESALYILRENESREDERDTRQEQLQGKAKL